VIEEKNINRKFAKFVLLCDLLVCFDTFFLKRRKKCTKKEKYFQQNKK